MGQSWDVLPARLSQDAESTSLRCCLMLSIPGTEMGTSVAMSLGQALSILSSPIPGTELPYGAPSSPASPDAFNEIKSAFLCGFLPSLDRTRWGC